MLWEKKRKLHKKVRIVRQLQRKGERGGQLAHRNQKRGRGSVRPLQKNPIQRTHPSGRAIGIRIGRGSGLFNFVTAEGQQKSGVSRRGNQRFRRTGHYLCGEFIGDLERGVLIRDPETRVGGMPDDQYFARAWHNYQLRETETQSSYTISWLTNGGGKGSRGGGGGGGKRGNGMGGGNRLAKELTKFLTRTGILDSD